MKRVYLNTPEEVIKALKDGKEVFLEEGGAGKVKLIDGFCVKEWNDQFNINYTINLRDKPFVYEQEPLKIEVGKFYKTRDGRKAIVYAKMGIDCPYPFCVVKVGRLDAYNANEEGKLAADELPLDLVAPCED